MNRENIGFIVSTGLLVAGYFWVNNYYAQKNPPPAISAAQISTPSPTVSPTAAPNATETPAPLVPAISQQPQNITPANPADLAFNLEKLDILFTQTGGCIASVKANRYAANVHSTNRAEIFPNHQVCKAYGLRVGKLDLRDKPAQIVRGENRISLIQVADALEVTRSFEFQPDSYRGKFTVSAKNISAAQQSSSVFLEMGARSESQAHTGMFSSTPLQGEGLVYRASDSVTRIAFPFEKEPSQKVLAAPTKLTLDWVEVGSMHFLNALLPLQKDPLNLLVNRTGTLIQENPKAPFDQTVYEAWLELPFDLQPNASKSFAFDLYLGPKSKTELDKFGSRNLTETVNYGFFAVVAWPLFYALSFIHKVVGNWGVAIIILTAFVKMLLYPLALKSYISSKKMTKVQPQMKALQEKYKDDKQKLNQEMMALMSQSGANPLGGCLPILPQFPIFFGLFSVFQQTFELRHAPFYGWVKDLSVMDPYFVLPVLMMALYVVQQRITPMPPSLDPMQKRMMQFMPFIFSLMMITFPSGLVLYFVTNTLLTIAQQVYMMRKYKEV